MRVRIGCLAAAFAAALAVLASSSAAAADPPAIPPAPTARPLQIAPLDPDPRALSLTRAEPLGAWLEAVTAALETVRRAIADARVAADRALAPSPARPIPWQRVGAAGEGDPRRAGAAVVQLGPAEARPPSEANADVRGQRATLLGARVTLPWRVP